MLVIGLKGTCLWSYVSVHGEYHLFKEIMKICVHVLLTGGGAGDRYLLHFGILLPTGKCMSHRCRQHFYLEINILLGWWFKTLHIFSSLFLYSHAYKLGTQPSLHSLFSTHMSKDRLGRDVHPTECAFLVKNDMNWNIKHTNRLKDTKLCPTSIPGINSEVHRLCRKQDPDSAVQ